jgi:hypothetical protein
MSAILPANSTLMVHIWRRDAKPTTPHIARFQLVPQLPFVPSWLWDDTSGLVANPREFTSARAEVGTSRVRCLDTHHTPNFPDFDSHRWQKTALSPRGPIRASGPVTLNRA